MNKLFKLDPETRFLARLAAIALSLPLLLLCGFLLSSLIRAIF